jgi:hypothetical protein
MRLAEKLDWKGLIHIPPSVTLENEHPPPLPPTSTLYVHPPYNTQFNCRHSPTQSSHIQVTRTIVKFGIVMMILLKTYPRKQKVLRGTNFSCLRNDTVMYSTTVFMRAHILMIATFWNVARFA